MNQKTQLELDFEAGLTQRYPEIMDCVRAVVHGCGVPLKSIAADIDKSQSDFSRELAENPNDNRFLKVHDLPQIITSCGQRGHDIIHWLAEKHLEDPETRKQRAQAMLTELIPAMMSLIQEVNGRDEV